MSSRVEVRPVLEHPSRQRPACYGDPPFWTAVLVDGAVVLLTPSSKAAEERALDERKKLGEVRA